MQLLDIIAVEPDFRIMGANDEVEHYPQSIVYRALGVDGEHRVRIGFKTSSTYGRERRRVVVWIDDVLQAGFLAADDFEHTGDVLSEIRIPGNTGERICRYRDEAIPERYSGLPIVGLPTRVSGSGVHKAWAVVTNIADHRVMCALAALRRLERAR